MDCLQYCNINAVTSHSTADLSNLHCSSDIASPKFFGEPIVCL